MDRLNTNNNINGNRNIKYIYDFANEMNDKLKKLENFTEFNKIKDNDNDDNQTVYKKSIQVNTAKWKFRKKSSNKNRVNKINEDLNLNLNIKRKNTSSSFRKDFMINKLNI